MQELIFGVNKVRRWPVQEIIGAIPLGHGLSHTASEIKYSGIVEPLPISKQYSLATALARWVVLVAFIHWDRTLATFKTESCGNCGRLHDGEC